MVIFHIVAGELLRGYLSARTFGALTFDHLGNLFLQFTHLVKRLTSNEAKTVNDSAVPHRF